MMANQKIIRSKIMAAITTTKQLFTKHRVPQEPPAEFDELVYALSSVRHIHDHSPTKSLLREGHKKILKLLDGIALLLVMSESDVAAVSFLQTPTAIKFYFAKNYPCTEEELNYINSVIQMIRYYDGSDGHKVALEIVKKAASGCTKKIRNRIGKIIKELKNSELATEMLESDIANHKIWQETGKPEGVIRQAVYQTLSINDDSDRGDKLFSNCTDKELLISYFELVAGQYLSVVELRKDLVGLAELITLSYNIGKIDPF